MAHALRNAKVPPNSATLAEAKGRVRDLFKKACRSLPTVMNLYHLDDIVTVSQLRSAVSSKIRKNAHITNPKIVNPKQKLVSQGILGWKWEMAYMDVFLQEVYTLVASSAEKQVIDLLVFNGMEELANIIEHYKQRHHIIGEYVIGHGLVQDKDVKDQGSSEFLKQFYKTNYF